MDKLGSQIELDEQKLVDINTQAATVDAALNTITSSHK